MEIDIRALELLPGDEAGLDFKPTCRTITCTQTCDTTCFITGV